MTELERKDLTEIIEWESSQIMNMKGLDERKEINNGYCMLLNRSVFDSVRNNYGTEYVTWSRDSDDPQLIENTYGEDSMVDGSHAWIEFREYHFDAEETDGVLDPSDLPIFERTSVMDPLE